MPRPYERWDDRKKRESSKSSAPQPKFVNHSGTCIECGNAIVLTSTQDQSSLRRRKYCSRSCWGIANVKKQQQWEQDMAKEMESKGWKIIRPMSCCDRIGIKDGKVYFIEFKTPNDHMREFQLLVQSLAPERYKVVVGNWE